MSSSPSTPQQLSLQAESQEQEAAPAAEVESRAYTQGVGLELTRGVNVVAEKIGPLVARFVMDLRAGDGDSFSSSVRFTLEDIETRVTGAQYQTSEAVLFDIQTCLREGWERSDRQVEDGDANLVGTFLLALWRRRPSPRSFTVDFSPPPSNPPLEPTEGLLNFVDWIADEAESDRDRYQTSEGRLRYSTLVADINGRLFDDFPDNDKIDAWTMFRRLDVGDTDLRELLLWTLCRRERARKGKGRQSPALLNSHDDSNPTWATTDEDVERAQEAWTDAPQSQDDGIGSEVAWNGQVKIEEDEETNFFGEQEEGDRAYGDEITWVEEMLVEVPYPQQAGSQPIVIPSDPLAPATPSSSSFPIEPADEEDSSSSSNTSDSPSASRTSPEPVAPPPSQDVQPTAAPQTDSAAQKPKRRQKKKRAALAVDESTSESVNPQASPNQEGKKAQKAKAAVCGGSSSSGTARPETASFDPAPPVQVSDDSTRSSYALPDVPPQFKAVAQASEPTSPSPLSSTSAQSSSNLNVSPVAGPSQPRFGPVGKETGMKRKLDDRPAAGDTAVPGTPTSSAPTPNAKKAKPSTITPPSTSVTSGSSASALPTSAPASALPQATPSAQAVAAAVPRSAAQSTSSTVASPPVASSSSPGSGSAVLAKYALSRPNALPPSSSPPSGRCSSCGSPASGSNESVGGKLVAFHLQREKYEAQVAIWKRESESERESLKLDLRVANVHATKLEEHTGKHQYLAHCATEKAKRLEEEARVKNTTIDRLRSEASRNRVSIEKLQTDAGVHEDTIEDLKERVKALEKSNSDLTSSVGTLKADNASLVAAAEAAETARQELELEYKTALSQSEEEIRTLLDEKKATDRLVADLRGSVKTMESGREEMRTQSAKDQDTIKRLNVAKNDLDTRLLTERSTAHEKRTGLTAELKTLTVERDELLEENKVLEIDMLDLEKKNEALEKQRDTFKTLVGTLEEDVRTLQRKNEKLEGEAKAHKTEVEALTQKIDALTKRVEESEKMLEAGRKAMAVGTKALTRSK